MNLNEFDKVECGRQDRHWFLLCIGIIIRIYIRTNKSSLSRHTVIMWRCQQKCSSTTATTKQLFSTIIFSDPNLGEKKKRCPYRLELRKRLVGESGPLRSNEAFINKTKAYRYQKLTCREESAAFGDEKEESLAWHYDPRDFSLRPRERERDPGILRQCLK